MIALRAYQFDLVNAIREAWRRVRNVLATAPTGAGKTVIFSHILAQHKGTAVVVAHRQELISQISISLAREGVRHSIIAPRTLCKLIMRLHVEEVGACFYDPAARVTVASVDTLRIRADQFPSWCQQVTLCVMDEAHHVLKENKWGFVVALFPNAIVLGVTATAVRADGKGLGRHADGVFDTIVNGPSMRDLIELGYLTNFKIFAPETKLDLATLPVGASGDYVHKALVAEVRKSKLVGNVVEHYQRIAPGLRGITFVTDVETAHRTAVEFLAAGVPTAAVSAKTPERERYNLVRKFRRGELLQLVNVDLFGEGVDIPSVSVVSMARPTLSLPLYIQQAGRMARIFEGKPYGILIDHVNNVRTHNGGPDKSRVWSLDRSPQRRRGERDPDVVPIKICVECSRDFEAVYKICPYCATPYTPGRRDGPEFVEGDLIELDPATLAEMQSAVRQVDRSPDAIFHGLREGGASHAVAGGAAKQQRARIGAQTSLRKLIGLFGGLQQSRGRDTPEAHKRFYFRYGVDVLSAQALGRPDAERLSCQLLADIGAGKV